MAEDDEGSTKRPRFGTRTLKEEDDVFQQNAWDHVEWTPEEEQKAALIVEKQLSQKLPDEMDDQLEEKAGSNWHHFYEKHENKFFKDRHWLFTEFPELLRPYEEPSEPKAAEETAAVTAAGPDAASAAEPISADAPAETLQERFNRSSHSSWRVLEVGCGVGNTVFPLLAVNRHPETFVYACDFAASAIDILRHHEQYTPRRCHAFTADITASPVLPPQSLDVVILIFVLSAVHPEKMQAVLNHLAESLRPGGILLLRDYGRYDLAQLRFKGSRCISENFYMRGDGTRVYFFTQDELRTMLTQAGLTEQQNVADRRLLVNRGRQITMQRVWIQCKYVKP